MDKYSLPLVGEWLYRRGVAAEGGQKTSILARRRVWENQRVKVGMHTYGGCFEPTFNVGGAFVSVGRYCSIAQRVSYFGASHPVERAVMSPYFYNRAFAGFNVDDVTKLVNKLDDKIVQMRAKLDVERDKKNWNQEWQSEAK